MKLNVYIFLSISSLALFASEQNVKKIKQQIAQKEDEIHRLVMGQPHSQDVITAMNDFINKVIPKDKVTREMKQLEHKIADMEMQKCIRLHNLPEASQLFKEISEYQSKVNDLQYNKTLQEIHELKNQKYDLEDKLNQAINEQQRLEYQLEINALDIKLQPYQPFIDELDKTRDKVYKDLNRLNELSKNDDATLIPLHAQFNEFERQIGFRDPNLSKSPEGRKIQEIESLAMNKYYALIAPIKDTLLELSRDIKVLEKKLYEIAPCDAVEEQVKMHWSFHADAEAKSYILDLIRREKLSA